MRGKEGIDNDMQTETTERPTMKMLPGDEVRQIMWRFAERYDIQMAVAGARSVARGIVAQLVAGGQRKTHDWTAEKQGAFDGSSTDRRTSHPRSFHTS